MNDPFCQLNTIHNFYLLLFFYRFVSKWKKSWNWKLKHTGERNFKQKFCRNCSFIFCVSFSFSSSVVLRFNSFITFYFSYKHSSVSWRVRLRQTIISLWTNAKCYPFLAILHTNVKSYLFRNSFFVFGDGPKRVFSSSVFVRFLINSFLLRLSAANILYKKRFSLMCVRLYLIIIFFFPLLDFVPQFKFKPKFNRRQIEKTIVNHGDRLQNICLLQSSTSSIFRQNNENKRANKLVCINKNSPNFSIFRMKYVYLE